MRVLVTGATGLVGCHTAAALVRAGHEVRAMVRNLAKIERALGPFGLSGVDSAVGDVTDARSVAAALEGCDAVVHTAALFTLDRRRREETLHTNVEGTRNVLGAAQRLGLDPIVYVSSISALFPPGESGLTPDAPVQQPSDPYAQSKAQAERYARSLQDEGAPVVCVYPGSIWGPNDPTLSDGITTIMRFVKQGIIPVTPGGIPIVDVRDLADLHARVMRPGQGPRRYMLGGHFLNNRELTETLSQITGRHIRTVYIPGGLMRGIGRVVDVLQRALGIDLGITYEAAVTLTRMVPHDDSRVEKELGITARPTAETLSDTLRWMCEEGVVEPRDVGLLAE